MELRPLQPLQPRAELLVLVPVAVLVRALESCKRHLRARLVRYFPRLQYLYSAQDSNFWRLPARLEPSVPSLLAQVGLAR